MVRFITGKERGRGAPTPAEIKKRMRRTEERWARRSGPVIIIKGKDQPKR